MRSINLRLIAKGDDAFGIAVLLDSFERQRGEIEHQRDFYHVTSYEANLNGTTVIYSFVLTGYIPPVELPNKYIRGTLGCRIMDEEYLFPLDNEVRAISSRFEADRKRKLLTARQQILIE